MNSAPISNPAADDALAVQAIRNGDRERYRELVERHADRVFAIAWCRLGDRDLAEEASQEAFIAAYRRLPLLGHAERFGAWIAAITRNSAINLGLRRRGELRKRERWALEHEETASEPEPSEDSETSRESLRTTLGGLPTIHRECLVLFYLENRSVAECAELLGISENAFKVRLHRARSVLREALETRLESDLDRLRAPSRLAHAVMVALPAQSGGLALFGGVVSALAKVTPFGLFLFAFQLFALIPSLAFARWLGEKDLANFKEPDGFRARLYRRFLRHMLLAVGIITVVAVVASRALELRHYSMVVGTVLLLSSFDYLRRLLVLRNPVLLASVFGILVLGGGLLGSVLANNAFGILYLGQGIFFALMAWVTPRIPQRMDHSLLARAAHGLLPPPDPSESPVHPSPAHPAGARLASRGFAAFLGRYYLVDNWRNRPEGLELSLAPAVPNVLASAVPWYWGKSSRLLLRDDGRVEVRLGETDGNALAAAFGETLPPARDLEDRLALALHRGRVAWERKDQDAALRWLGQQSADAIFVRDPARTAAVRWRVWILRCTAVLMSVGGIATLTGTNPFIKRPASFYQPVALEEPEVRAFLARIATDTQASNRNVEPIWNTLLYRGVCLPAPSLFPAS
ncbi:MAG: sigma-70 family RNA polymerase sigma factor, partial [Verrucomicrobiales bacterium]|nr:sigma-70 family RNA polymerase sigma factor [Verrucomicrobiales bacterium]